jgi:hypothetical protein
MSPCIFEKNKNSLNYGVSHKTLFPFKDIFKVLSRHDHLVSTYPHIFSCVDWLFPCVDLDWLCLFLVCDYHPLGSVAQPFLKNVTLSFDQRGYTYKISLDYFQNKVLFYSLKDPKISEYLFTKIKFFCFCLQQLEMSYTIYVHSFYVKNNSYRSISMFVFPYFLRPLK